MKEESANEAGERRGKRSEGKSRELEQERKSNLSNRGKSSDAGASGDNTGQNGGRGSSKYRLLGSKRAALGGILAFLVLFAGTYSVGEISGVEARSLLTSMLPTARFLYSAVVTASATILALMLTLLGLSFNTQSELDPSHYYRVRQIALIDTITFITAMAFLLFLVVPLDQPKSIVPMWYEVFYYVTIGGSAILGGLLVTIVLMLYATVRDMITIFGLGKEDHPLVSGKEE